MLLNLVGAPPLPPGGRCGGVVGGGSETLSPGASGPLRISPGNFNVSKMTPNWDVQVNSFDTAPSLRGAKGPGGAAEGGAKGMFREMSLKI